MAEHVVGARGLLDPPRLVHAQPAHRRDRLLDVPDLIGVHHQHAVRAERAANQPCAPVVGVEVGADLHLHVREARISRFEHERFDLVIPVAEPARRRRVRRVARGDDFALPLDGPRTRGAQDADGLLRRQGIRDVPEVDAAHELLRRHVGEELPQGLVLALRPQVPDCIHDRARGEVDDALLGPQPAQLRIRGEASPEPAHVPADLLEGAADDERGERTDGGHAYLGAAPARERQPMPLEAVTGVGAQDDVGRRIVRVGMHRVRAVQPTRGREADVACLEAHDGGAAAHLRCPGRRNNPTFRCLIAEIASRMGDSRHKDRVIATQGWKVAGRSARRRREPGPVNGLVLHARAGTGPRAPPRPGASTP